MAERADFYVLEGSDARERLKLACRITAKAFDADLRVLVWCSDAAELRAFDDLLWSHAQDSFIPHEPAGPESSWDETPVLLACSDPAPAGAEVLVNLSAQVPAAAATVARVVEVIDADPARRQAGRERFKAYRSSGATTETHNISA
jgi:DNA polymerase III subunit chi